MKSALYRSKEPLSSSQRAIVLPPAAMTTTIIVYLLLSIGLAVLMGVPSLLPIAGLVGAIAINLIVLLFVRSEAALPLYLLVAGPSVALSLSSSGILSRLYLGNLMFFLLTVIWLIGKLLSQRKAGRWLLTPTLLLPLLSIIIVGVISIILSHLFPDPNVTYSFPHSTTAFWVVNAAEIMILIGLPLFLVVVLGVGRPQVFGEVSSGLGTMLVLFACIALCRAFYTSTRGERITWGVLTAVFSLGVIMTIGRESWIALLLAFLTIVIIYTKNWKLPLLVVIPLIPLVLVSGATNFYDPSHVYGVDRLVIWQDAITIWQHSPIIGIGAGNYQFFDIAYGKDVVGIAHNQYLQVLAEMGVFGFVCLLWIMGATAWISIRSFRQARTALGKSLALAYLAYFVSIIFGGFFTSSFVPSAADGGGTAAFVSASYRWLLLGLVLSIPAWEGEITTGENASTARPRQAHQSLLATR